MTSSQASVTALLVGVSSYPSLPENRRLQGPKNDVPLMVDGLGSLGVARQDMTVLADGVAGSDGLPTRQNILNALARFKKTAPAGGWAILYFSGHGSQQPYRSTQRDHREPDRLAELFLPYDIGRWDGASGHVANALADAEIAAEIRGLRARGVNVWAIFDTCHAGGMGKGVLREVGDPVWRYVAPELLGVPSEAPVQQLPDEWGERSMLWAAAVEGISKGGIGARFGALVIFASSQEGEPSAEESLQVPARGRRAPTVVRRYGVFTWHLVQTLAAHPASFRQLATVIGDAYRRERPFPTPDFKGALDLQMPYAPVLR